MTYALKFVRFDQIEKHYRQGWMMSFPNAPMHHHVYGCELAWICSCPVPGLKRMERRQRRGFATEEEAESFAQAVLSNEPRDE